MLVIALIPLHSAYVAGNVSKCTSSCVSVKTLTCPISLESASLILKGRVLASGMLCQPVLCTKWQVAYSAPRQAPVTLCKTESTLFALCVWFLVSWKSTMNLHPNQPYTPVWILTVPPSPLKFILSFFVFLWGTGCMDSASGTFPACHPLGFSHQEAPGEMGVLGREASVSYRFPSCWWSHLSEPVKRFSTSGPSLSHFRAWSDNSLPLILHLW